MTDHPNNHASKDVNLNQFQTVGSSCSSPDGAYKIVHQYAPTTSSLEQATLNPASGSSLRNLQVVTQTLHIPPSGEVESANNELEKLRKEVKKLKEYARLSVQDRKVLIHKIGTLKDKVHETSSMRKSASPLRLLTSTEAEVQCNLLETKNYWLRFAKLQQKLVKFCEAADLLKTQLEAVCDILEPSVAEISKSNANIGQKLTNMSYSSQKLLKNVEKTLEDLKSESAASNSNSDCESSAVATERPDTSMSNEVLPDPNDLELPEMPHLDLLEAKERNLQALSDQIEQKDQIIREQAEHLDKYRMEILHLRQSSDSLNPGLQPQPLLRKTKPRNVADLADLEETEQSKVQGPQGLSEEEEDSWSEPGKPSLLVIDRNLFFHFWPKPIVNRK